MSDSRQPWYKSVGFIGLLLTLGGFGLFTLLYYLVSIVLLKP